MVNPALKSESEPYRSCRGKSYLFTRFLILQIRNVASMYITPLCQHHNSNERLHHLFAQATELCFVER